MVYRNLRFPTHNCLTSQVCSSGHPVPDCRKDCWDEEFGRGGRTAGDVHRVGHCGPPHPRPLCPATTLLHRDQEEPLQLHCRPAAGPYHCSGNLIKVKLILCASQVHIPCTFWSGIWCLWLASVLYAASLPLHTAALLLCPSPSGVWKKTTAWTNEWHVSSSQWAPPSTWTALHCTRLWQPSLLLKSMIWISILVRSSPSGNHAKDWILEIVELTWRQ